MRGDVKSYDVVVVGSGSGAIVMEQAVAQGLHVALVAKGPPGGTCTNVGCIPTKMIIVPADRVVEIQEASRLGITAQVEAVDFQSIMERMRRLRAHDSGQIQRGIEQAKNLDYYHVEGWFVDQHMLQVGETRIRADKIFVVGGARPLMPPIEGLDKIPYLDNESALDLEERPDSILFIGGGYVACEFAHFFAAMGTEVTIVQRNPYLVPDEEPELSSILYEAMSRRMKVHTNTEVVRVQPDGGSSGTSSRYRVMARDRASGEERDLSAQYVMVAAGRRSNADLLRVENAGIETDRRGYIRVNEYLETNVPGIWALGDIIGKQMFKHVANREAIFAWHNSHGEQKVSIDYNMTPHAVFSHPQIASVGLRESEAKQNHDVLVGRARYTDVVKGIALGASEGLVKAVVDAESQRILGFHIIGPYAPILIQEVVDVMATDGRASAVSFGIHIHPAMPEVIAGALGALTPADSS